MATVDRETIRDALEHVAQYGVLGSADARTLDVGTDRFLDYFETEILDDLIAHGGATCRFFEGSYGAGKTHLLRLLGDLALERRMAIVQTDLSQDLALEDWHSITKHILQNLLVQVEGRTVRGLPRVLEALKETDWVNPAALRLAQLPHAGFRNAIFRAIVEPEIPLVLYQYLSGERVALRQLQASGVIGVRDPLSRRNAELLLSTLTGSFFHLGLRGTMLLFDENDKTLESPRGVPSRKVRIAANLIRRLIDSCATGGLIGTAVVLAVLPGFLENCSRQYSALGQRLEMVREEQAPAWRWPVLPIEWASTARDRSEFLEQAVARFASFVPLEADDANGLKAELMTEGLRVLEGQAGSGFRRTLMKQLATITLEHLDKE